MEDKESGGKTNKDRPHNGVDQWEFGAKESGIHTSEQDQQFTRDDR